MKLVPWCPAKAVEVVADGAKAAVVVVDGVRAGADAAAGSSFPESSRSHRRR
jgi:glutamate synthase domain-containing protein 2